MIKMDSENIKIIDLIGKYVYGIVAQMSTAGKDF